MVNFCCAILDAKAGQEREGHRFFRWIGTDVRSGLLLLELGAKEAYIIKSVRSILSQV